MPTPSRDLGLTASFSARAVVGLGRETDWNCFPAMETAR